LYEAFRRAWDRAPGFAGSYFWQWYGDGGETCHEYTPRNKPATGEIAKWYGGGKAARETAEKAK
jgi:hypothetical protein